MLHLPACKVDLIRECFSMFLPPPQFLPSPPIYPAILLHSANLLLGPRLPLSTSPLPLPLAALRLASSTSGPRRAVSKYQKLFVASLTSGKGERKKVYVAGNRLKYGGCLGKEERGNKREGGGGKEMRKRDDLSGVKGVRWVGKDDFDEVKWN